MKKLKRRFKKKRAKYELELNITRYISMEHGDLCEKSCEYKETMDKLSNRIKEVDLALGVIKQIRTSYRNLLRVLLELP